MNLDNLFIRYGDEIVFHEEMERKKEFMTVQELIDKLKEFDPHTLVCDDAYNAVKIPFERILPIPIKHDIIKTRIVVIPFEAQKL